MKGWLRGDGALVRLAECPATNGSTEGATLLALTQWWGLEPDRPRLRSAYHRAHTVDPRGADRVTDAI